MRAASAETLVVADGFRCREQIAQTTGRRALHLADVLPMSLRGGLRAGRALVADGAAVVGAWRRPTIVAGGVLVVGAATAWALARRRAA